MRPYCIGLTGGAGAGKSTVAEMFADLGAAIIDTDVISRELTSAAGMAMPAIRRAFGPKLVDRDGAMDRPAMRAYVFSDPAARGRLEAILHPLIREAAARQLLDAATPYAMLVVPLLAEHLEAYGELVDRVLVVDCDESQQIQRISTRPAISPQVAEAILASQSRREARLSIADDVLDNRGDLLALAEKVSVLHRKYMALARSDDLE